MTLTEWNECMRHLTEIEPKNDTKIEYRILDALAVQLCIKDMFGNLFAGQTIRTNYGQAMDKDTLIRAIDDAVAYLKNLI